MYIMKRSGIQEIFDASKIVKAIEGANAEVPLKDRLTENEIKVISEDIFNIASERKVILNVEDIQDMVEDHIYDLKKYVVGRKYSRYRYQHTKNRKDRVFNKKMLSIVDCKNEEVNQENSNKNTRINSVQRDYLAGEVSKKVTAEELLPEDIWLAHQEGIIHFHDSDYFINYMINCCLVNLEDMLQNGTVINGKKIETPKSFLTACNIMTQIMAAIASSQYGGQSMTLSHIAPFVDVSRQKIRKKLLEDFDVQHEDELSEELRVIFDRSLEHRLHDEIVNGVQTIQYQILTLFTTNGQTPFVTLFAYLNEVPEGQLRDDLAMIIEEVFNQRLKGIQNEVGEWVTAEFPKLIFVLDENNVHKDSKYYYLKKLAIKCSLKRMVPDYISAKIEKQYKDGYVYPCMGCRSFLTSEENILNPDGTRKFYGRFNQGVVTINLPDVALSSGGDFDKFWDIFEERLELCHRALRIRHEHLLGTPSDVAPIAWQHGGLARLEKGETIDKLLYGGYSTISLGYCGLYETVKYMTGYSHTEPNGHPFSIEVMNKLNEKCKEWRATENIAYSVYGTPLESTTYKFAKALQRRFGVIEGITDHNYVTNSYHVNVREDIDAFTKLSFEAPFQILSPGGAISYVELPDLSNNQEAGEDVVDHIYETNLYAELNSKSDYCYICDYDGEIQIKEEESGRLYWECPCCGNTDQSKMSVARRTCGYIGTQFWNQGRTQEIRDRKLHLDNCEWTKDFQYENGN